MKLYWRLLITAVVIVCVIMIIKATGVSRYLTLVEIQQRMHAFKACVISHPLRSAAIYMAAMAITAALSIPIIMPLVLLSGFLFGALLCAVYATIGALVGVIASFLLFRYVLGGMIRRRYGKRLEKFNQQMHAYGPSYLLILHYLTVVPYFIINAFAALTPISLPRFIVLTFLGSFPINLMYAFAGLELGTISSTRDIFTPTVILACLMLILLACMPIILKKYRKRMDV